MMNPDSQVIMTLEHYKVLIRDTLEYTIARDSYDMNAFKQKKDGILIELDQNTPLKSIIANSGENGEKLEKLIRDFHEQVYGDGSTILKASEDGLRVDHAQHLAIFKGVLPIHENIEAMVRGILNEANKRGNDVSEVAKVDQIEERFYRAIAYMTLTNQLVKLFGDYNQARNEAHGEESAASKFIGNDINEVIQDLQIVRGNTRFTDAEFLNVQDHVFTLVEYMTGRRDRPLGKSFGDIINETQKVIHDFVAVVEPQFKDAYVPALTELIQEANANGGRIGAGAKAATDANVKTDEEAKEEDFTEIDPKTGLPK